jgi:hypothetical protein
LKVYNKRFHNVQEFSYTEYEEGFPHIRPQSTQSVNDHFLVYIHHDGKISPELVGGGGHAHPLSLYLPSRTKLCCKLQLKGQIHSPSFYSTPICTLCIRLCARSLPSFPLFSTMWVQTLESRCFSS